MVLKEKHEYSDEVYFYEMGPARKSGSDGSFTVEGGAFPGKKILYVELTDVDGVENGGLFATVMKEADFTDATFTGASGNWYEGIAEIDLGPIIMELDNSTTLE